MSEELSNGQKIKALWGLLSSHEEAFENPRMFVQYCEGVLNKLGLRTQEGIHEFFNLHPEDFSIPVNHSLLSSSYEISLDVNYEDYRNPLIRIKGQLKDFNIVSCPTWIVIKLFVSDESTKVPNIEVIKKYFNNKLCRFSLNGTEFILSDEDKANNFVFHPLGNFSIALGHESFEWQNHPLLIWSNTDPYSLYVGGKQKKITIAPCINTLFGEAKGNLPKHILAS